MLSMNSIEISEGNISAINGSVTCEPTVDEWKLYSSISWWVQGIASLILSSFGILLNSLALGILISSRNTKTASFNRLLVCLAVFDNLYLSNGISEALRGYLMKSRYYDYVFITFLYPFRSMVMFCSMYTTVVLAYVRYDAITRPLHYTIRARNQVAGPWGNAIKYITPVTLMSLLFYFPKFFEFKVTYINDNCLNFTFTNVSDLAKNCSENDYHISLTSLRREKNYVLWYCNIINFFITVVLPFTLLVYFYVRMYIGMKHFKKRQPSLRKELNQSTSNDATNNHRDGYEQSVIIIGLVLLFISCHILRVILNIQELVYFEWSSVDIARGCYGVKFWAMILVPISEFMLLTNSSANFFIYFLFYKDFRNLIQEKYNQIVLTSPIRSRTAHTNRDSDKTILQDKSNKSHLSTSVDHNKKLEIVHIALREIPQDEEKT